MKIEINFKKSSALAVALLLCVSLLGCQSKADKLAAEAAAAEESRIAAEEARLADIQDKINEVLAWTHAVDGFSLSLSSAIVNTFHQYKWSFEAYNNSETQYIVTFTGNYSPNPRDLPQLSLNGTISFLVDIESSQVRIYSDPDDISDAFLLLALPF